jgi:hypothetical protein
MSDIKYVTSRRTLEAAFEPLFRMGHLVHPKGASPEDAAKYAANLMLIHLSGPGRDHVPLRDAQGACVPDDEDFFG